ncbi:hypothetical protein ACM66B_002387 [Microbotryomycetes sp. NB124-2]
MLEYIDALSRSNLFEHHHHHLQQFTFAEVTPSQSTGSPAPSLSFESTRSPTPVSSVDALSPKQGDVGLHRAARSTNGSVHESTRSVHELGVPASRARALSTVWHDKQHHQELFDASMPHSMPLMHSQAQTTQVTYDHVTLQQPQPAYAAGYHVNAFAALTEPNAPPAYASLTHAQRYTHPHDIGVDAMYMARPAVQPMYAPLVQQQPVSASFATGSPQGPAAMPTASIPLPYGISASTSRPVEPVPAPAFSSLQTPQGTFYFVPHKTAAVAAQAFSDMAATSTNSIDLPALPDLPVASEQLSRNVEPLEPKPVVRIAEQSREPITGADTSSLIKRKTEPVVKPVKKSAGSSSKKPRKPRSTVKRFMCPQEGCGRAFARNFNMQSHLKSHLDIREFDCPLCPKKFSRRHDRGRHCATVHDYHVDDYQRTYHDGAEFQSG